MCIPKEEREKLRFELNDVNHVFQRLKERGTYLFDKQKISEMLVEAKRHILNDMRCVLIPDERENKDSSHIAIFVTDVGGLVAMPCQIDDKKISIMTLKDVIDEETSPEWYFKKYNEIGLKRGMSPLSFRVPSTVRTDKFKLNDSLYKGR